MAETPAYRSPAAWGVWTRSASKIVRHVLDVCLEERPKSVEHEEELIVAMARFSYTLATSGDKSAPVYDQLPMSAQFHWQTVTAQAWEIYWAVRERREDK